MANSKDDFINAVFAISLAPERFKSPTPIAEAVAAWPEIHRKMIEANKAYEHGK
jgi:hypothetical protein